MRQYIKVNSVSFLDEVYKRALSKKTMYIAFIENVEGIKGRVPEFLFSHVRAVLGDRLAGRIAGRIVGRIMGRIVS